MRSVARIVSLISLAACAPSVQTTTGATTGNGTATINVDRIAEDIRTVSSDAFLGRGPATRGEEIATNYIRDRLKAAGLEPGGTYGSWFQDVTLIQSDIVGTPTLAVNVGGQTFPLTQ